MSPKISVIVPIYRVEQYLEKCINSILQQSYDNLEIILVDDGSPDNCPLICDTYQEKDERVRVIHKKNGGLSSARNAGLEIATGEYITFVDSDDYIARDMVEVLYRNLIKYNSEISVCFWKEFLESDEVSEEKSEEYAVCVMDNVQAMKKMLYQRGTDSCAWGKLFSKELFNEIRFPVGKIYEDIAIMYYVFDKAKSVVFADYPGYFYLQRNTSIIRNKFSDSKMSVIDFVEENERFLKEKYPLLKNAAVSRTMRANFHVYLQIPGTKEFTPQRRRIESNIKERRRIVLKDSEAAKGTKAAILLTYLGFGSLRFLKNLKKFGKVN